MQFILQIAAAVAGIVIAFPFFVGTPLHHGIFYAGVAVFSAYVTAEVSARFRGH